MQKALTIAAIASLSLASEAMEDNQLNIFKTLGNDIKKAGQFVVSHPQIITTAVKILAKDDEMTENELNFWGTIATDAKKAGNFVVQHPELINTAVKILHRDDEVNDDELNFFKSLGNGIKKAANFVIEHPQVISTASKILARDDEIGDDELNFWGSLKTDVKKAGEFVVQHPQIVTTAVKILAKDDEIENELNIFKSIGNGVKKAGQFVVSHPQIITTAAKFLDDEEMAIYDPTVYDPIFGSTKPRFPIRPTPTFPERPIYIAFSDEELNILSTIKKDAKKAAEYAVSHPELVVKAVDLVKSISHHDDDELNIFKSIGNGLKKAGQFVVSHPQIITTAAKFLDDEEADQELFNLGKTISKVGHVAKDGLNVYKNVQSGNYIGAIKSGVQTVKDVKHHDDEELFNLHNVVHKAEEGVKKGVHYVEAHPEVVKQAVELVKILAKHDDEVDDELNVFKSIGNGLKKAGQFVVSHPQIITTAAKFLDDEEADQELFNLGKTIGKVGHIAKDGLNVYKNVQSGNYIGAIKSGVQTVKDIKHHDDEELFNLGKTISKVGHVAKDGLNVYKNVQSGNYVGAIKSGVQTVKDIKHHDDEELFNIHNAIHHAEEGVRKAGEYVAKHPETVKKAQQTVDEIIHAAGHKDVRRQAAKQALKYVAQHPEVIKKAVEKVEKLVRHHKTKKTEQVADEALFNLGGLIKDGLNIYGDIKNKNYGGLVNDGIQTFKDIKQKKHDDEELFNIHNAIHKVEGDIKNAAHRAEQGVKVAEHYVYDHRQQIANGAKKAVNYVAEHPEVVKQAIEIIKNLKHQDDDEELFNLGGLIKDGLNIAKDVKSHNYGDLVNHGIQTVKDVKETVKDVKHKRFLGH